MLKNTHIAQHKLCWYILDMSKLALTQKLTESERFPIHIGKTEAEKNPEDDSDAKIPKGPKIK